MRNSSDEKAQSCMCGSRRRPMKLRRPLRDGRMSVKMNTALREGLREVLPETPPTSRSEEPHGK